MVVLLDLDDDSNDLLFEPYHSADPYVRRNQPSHESADQHSDPANDHVEDERPNPNLNAFSAILSCYPIVTQLASLLDLNTLHDLSRTCRQFRANLLQYRNQLVTQSLKCSSEQLPGAAAGSDPRQAPNGADGRLGERITSGKIGKCARDMVGECRRCSVVVCRLARRAPRAGRVSTWRVLGGFGYLTEAQNCTSKPPPPVALPGRLRRLCKTCIKAPLAEVLSPSITAPPPSCNLLTYRSRSSPGGPSPYSSSSTLSTTPGSSPPAYSPSSSPDIPSPGSLRAKHAEDSDSDPADQPAFTTLAFLRTPCSCPDTVWLCQTCGHALRSADQTYQLGWTWRTKYSHLGGLGTGIGEGHEGVVCGLGEACRGGRDVEHEACGTPDEIAEMERRLDGSSAAGEAQLATAASASSTPLQPLFGPAATASSSAAAAAAATSAHNGLDGVGTPHDEWSGNSFFAQEIEGIGGRRVMKVKKMVRIGAAVKEYEDERESNNTYLGREKKGDNRAWCAWCNRLVPSRRDARALVERWGFDEATALCGDGRHV
ncbi:uncharacterized protein J3D65DRAFT_604622 [Phyllosticta citribraziliensis]|uniref:F-box domain-containing protein n=1 Tax=Phyllosticta citribraziliensis TaxID=989973 RepID=A0ABR1LJ28_9PEZI